MTNTRQTVLAVAALALLAGTGTLYVAEAVVPDEADIRTGTGRYALEAAPPVDTVFGWVVDVNGWLGKGLIGIKHEQAAVTAADLGGPLVILTDRGSVVYPVTLTSPSGPMMDNVRLLPFAEQRVTVTGKVVTRGKERGIVIQEIARAPVTEKTVSLPARESVNVRFVARVADLSYWLGKGDSCAADAKRARARAEDGEPLVLVSDSGYIYYPVVQTMATGPADISSLLKYCEQKVRVTGKVITRGVERGVVIDNVAAYIRGPTREVLKPGR